MGLLDKIRNKNKKKKADKSASEVKEKPVKVQRKKKEQMSEVLDESVASKIKEDLHGEEKLKATLDGKTVYLALWLNADDPVVGGINKKHKVDWVGDLISQIKNGRILTYIPLKLLDDNQLLIIPTRSTMDVLDGFKEITTPELKYKIALISDDSIFKDEDGDDCDYKISNTLITIPEVMEFVADPDTNATDFLHDLHAFDDNANVNNKANIKNDDPLFTENKDDPNGLEKDDGAEELLKNGDAKHVSSGENAGLHDDSSTPFPIASSGDQDNNQDDNQDASVDDDPNASADDFVDEQADTDVQGMSDEQVEAELNELPPDDFIDADDDNTADPSADDELQDTSDINDYEMTPEDKSVDENIDTKGDTSWLQHDEDETESDNMPDISEDQVDKALIRKFYSDDLNLPISTKDFDNLVDNNNKLILFDEHRGEGYLNEYLNQLSKEANQDLKSLHQKNISQTRQTYYELLTRAVEKIVADLDDQDPKTDYGQKRMAIEGNRDSSLASLDAKIAAKQQALDEAFEKAKEEDAQRAATAARQSYNDRMQGQLNNDKEDAAKALKEDVISRANRNLLDLHTKQKDESAQLLDQAQTQILSQMVKKYRVCLKAEFDVENKWRKRIRDFTTHHRKEESVHDLVKQKQLDQGLAVKELQEKTDRDLAKAQADLEKRIADDTAKITALREKNDAEFKKQSESFARQLKEQQDADAADKAQALSDQQLKHDQEIAELKSKQMHEISDVKLDKTKAVSDAEAKLKEERIANANKVSGLENQLANSESNVKALNAQMKDLDAVKTREIKAQMEAKYDGQLRTKDAQIEATQQKLDNWEQMDRRQRHGEAWGKFALVVVSALFGGGAMWGFNELHPAVQTQVPTKEAYVSPKKQNGLSKAEQKKAIAEAVKEATKKAEKADKAKQAKLTDEAAQQKSANQYENVSNTQD